MNYYEILNVSNKASQVEIKKSYKKLALLYHPDLNNNINQEKFIMIKEAYDVLKDEKKRRKYDVSFSEEKENKENLEEKELYECFKDVLLTKFPIINNNIYTKVINLIFNSEEELKQDINNFNILNLYNKFNKDKINEKIIYATFEEKYLNKYRKIVINNVLCTVALREEELILEFVENIKIKIKILCSNLDKNIILVENRDILIYKNILELDKHKEFIISMPGEDLLLNLNSKKLIVIKNKGLYYNNNNFNNLSSDYEDVNNENLIRGDLFVYVNLI
jgi:hypothetical protein